MMQLFTPKQYMKIDVANSFGLDKLNWEDRIHWFDTNESRLLSLLSDADTPAMYYAGVKAWEDVKAGRPTGYPISLDATSSGIQILSVLTGDKAAARLSNVINAKKRNDAYQILYKSMEKRAGDSSGTITKEAVKKSIMTALYGSEAVPKKVFGEGRRLAIFFQTLEEEMPHVWELNKAFLSMWDPDALGYSWVLPDNFHVNMKVEDQVQESVEFFGETFITHRNENRPVAQGRSLGANVTHSVDGFIVRELLRRCDHNPKRRNIIYDLLVHGITVSSTSEDDTMVGKLWKHYQESGYLSARILDHLGSDNIHLVSTTAIHELLSTLPVRPFKIIPVHDCFRVHPNYGNDLRRQYNLQLSLVAQSNMLQFILSQLLKTPVPINKQADFAHEILDADYALS